MPFPLGRGKRFRVRNLCKTVDFFEFSRDFSLKSVIFEEKKGEKQRISHLFAVR